MLVHIQEAVLASDGLPLDREMLPCGECKALVPSLSLFCPHCSHFLIQYSRSGLVLFIASTLGALVLFRSTGALWMFYLLVASFIVHLYAVVFTRGSALVSAVFVTTSVTTLWGAWELANWISNAAPTNQVVVDNIAPIQRLVEPYVGVVPMLAWSIGVFWAISLGRTNATGGIRLASSYFLATGAFILGLWGVWGVLIQSQLYRQWVFQLAVVLALLVPLVLLVVLLGQPVHERRADSVNNPESATDDPAWGSVAALWFLFITAYLASTQFLTTAVQFGLGHYLPRLLGLQPLGDVQLPWLITVLRWRSPIASILIAGAILSLAATSAAQAGKGFPERRASLYGNAMDAISK